MTTYLGVDTTGSTYYMCRPKRKHIGDAHFLSVQVKIVSADNKAKYYEYIFSTDTSPNDIKLSLMGMYVFVNEK